MSNTQTVAIVTGGAQGIGLATAWNLARSSTVVIADINEQLAKAKASELSAAGH
ncbi:MAG: SDR family NAD(P)-dependent oxidoreductase, partial [Bryobacteraceae bacterium]